MFPALFNKPALKLIGLNVGTSKKPSTVSRPTFPVTKLAIRIKPNPCASPSASNTFFHPESPDSCALRSRALGQGRQVGAVSVAAGQRVQHRVLQGVQPVEDHNVALVLAQRLALLLFDVSDGERQVATAAATGVGGPWHAQQRRRQRLRRTAHVRIHPLQRPTRRQQPPVKVVTEIKYKNNNYFTDTRKRKEKVYGAQIEFKEIHVIHVFYKYEFFTTNHVKMA